MAVNIEKVKKTYGIVGNDARLNRAVELAVLVAKSPLTVLITGESGVGKEVFSHIIHKESDRKKQSFVAVNCGAIPEGTIESALFGHKKGAFTGADRDRKGYFTEADKGTIYLDEVGELPPMMQVKLLRVLENGEVTPVGESMPHKVDVRVVAATNKNLEEAVREGRFREDLYYRLCQMNIYVPPLRERQDDIPLLFCHFANEFVEESHRPPVTLADDNAIEYLMHFPWKGNVRELKNITKRISWIEPERVITREILQKYIQTSPAQIVPVGYTADPSIGGITEREMLLKLLSNWKMLNEMRDELLDLRHTVEQLKGHSIIGETLVTPPPSHPFGIPQQNKIHPAPDDDYVDVTPPEDVPPEPIDNPDLPLNLLELERLAINKALKKHNNNRKLAAEDLGISERTLYRRINDLGL